MTRERLHFALFSVALATVGIASLCLSWMHLPPVVDARFWLLGASLVVSEWLSIVVPGGANVSMSAALNTAAIILLGPTSAAILCGVSVLPIALGKPRPTWDKIAVNLGMLLLMPILAGWAYLLAGGRLLYESPLARQDFPGVLLPLVLLVGVLVAVNMVVVSIGLRLLEGAPIGRTWRDVFVWGLPSQLAMGLVGVAIAQVTSAVGIGGFALFVVPLVVARQLYQRYLALREAYSDTVRSLVGAIEAKDPYTMGHSLRVAEYVVSIAKQMGQREEAAERLEQAALLHDVGKIGVSRAVLSKDSQLSDEEFDEIRKHPDIAAHILETAPHLADVVPIVQYHHERYDGAGYCAGLVGEAIPLEARILAVADCFDAMTSDRPYRRALTREEAVEELRRNVGTQFDESPVEALIATLRDSDKTEAEAG